MRKVVLLLFLAVTSLCMAQKKELSQAKANIKAGNNLAQAEQSMRKLLEDSDNIRETKIWLTMFEAIKKQYDKGNEKLYLKQKYDTAALFNIARRLFVDMERFDSIDAMPDKKGRVRPEYRKKHAEMLNTLRPNLYNGAFYFIGKGKYGEAYNCLDTYINCGNAPLFTGRNYIEKDTLMPKAAFWAVYCGYKMKDPVKTLHHTYLALKKEKYWEPMLQYLSATYLLESDTTRYLKSLHEGFERFKQNSYFYTQLVAYYSGKGRWDKALDINNAALKANPADSLLSAAKSTILLNLSRYDECLALCDSIIARGDSAAEVMLNAGLACFNKAVEISVQGKPANRNKQKQEQQRLYKQALPYLEKARKALPALKDKWGLPLYTIYLNLNMGEEFEEIDRVIKNVGGK